MYQQSLFSEEFSGIFDEPRNIKVRVRDAKSARVIEDAFGVHPKPRGEVLGAKDLGYYEDMPRFVQKQEKPFGYFDINTHVSSDELSEILNQKITDKTKSVWYPKLYRSLDSWGWKDRSGLKPKYPIYILSKGRPRCITAMVLDKSGVDYTIVVEPQEEAMYRERWGSRVHVGDFDTTSGCSIPVRNYIDDISSSDKYWLMDDNIEAFYVLTDNTKYESRTPAIFRAAEDFCDRFGNVGQAGLNYHSFCKKTDSVPPYYLNTRIYSCTLMNRSVKGVRVDGKLWRGRWNEDTDLSLRVLKAGYCTILLNSFLAGKVTTQRMSGGNTDSVYTGSDNRDSFAQSLVDQHPDVTTKSFKFGRWHHHVDYKGFNQELSYLGHEKIDYGLYLDKNARGR